MAAHDLAIRWADSEASLQRIRSLGGVPLFGYPQHLRPGGLVAIVQREGRVALRFEVARIDGPCAVTLADGNRRENGYVVRAKRGSIRSPRVGETTQLVIKWHALGEIRYWDVASGRPVNVSDPTTSGNSDYLAETNSSHSSLTYRAYRGGIPGKPRNDPEAQLVDAYVTWMDCLDRFAQPYLASEDLRTDLFDRSRWRLIEAKATVDRRTLRTAVGQLYDYRRFFLRRPSLGVLLPTRPASACLRYLADCRVTCIWKTPTGRFSDSSEGMVWTVGDRVRTKA